MNIDHYQLGSNSTELNEKAIFLMRNIVFLANERVYHDRFPAFASIKYTDLDEQELVEHIEDLEKLYETARKETDFGLLHHQAHPYLIRERNGYYHVYPNDAATGTDQNNNAPVAGGRTALECLQNAWKTWSIPPVLILNSTWYCPKADINTIAGGVL